MHELARLCNADGISASRPTPSCMPAVWVCQRPVCACSLPRAVTGDADVLSAELAPGLGEILASGTRGSPWRLEAHKSTSAVTATAFANFSRAFLPPGAADELRASNGAVYAPPSSTGGIGEGEGGGGTAVAPAPPATALHLQVVDYSRQPMSGERCLLREGLAGSVDEREPGKTASRLLARFSHHPCLPDQ